MKIAMMIATAVLLLGACATTNPGNVGAGMYENMLTQRAALQGGTSAAAGNVAANTVASVGAVRSCDEIDADVKVAYLGMQQDDPGLARRVLATGEGIGETVALSHVTSHVPGAGMVNSLLKMRTGKKKVEQVFDGQMTQMNTLQTLKAERDAAGCSGSMLALFEEK